MRPLSESVYWEAFRLYLLTFIEHWLCSGGAGGLLSRRINLTPRISPQHYLPGLDLCLRSLEALYFRSSHSDVCNWRAESFGFGRSGQWPHRFNGFARCNFRVRQLHRWRRSCFPKCLLLFSAGARSRLWRGRGETCQRKPTESWWVSHRRGSRDQLAVHWNSWDIGTWPSGPFSAWLSFFLHPPFLLLWCLILILIRTGNTTISFQLHLNLSDLVFVGSTAK